MCKPSNRVQFAPKDEIDRNSIPFECKPRDDQIARQRKEVIRINPTPVSMVFPVSMWRISLFHIPTPGLRLFSGDAMVLPIIETQAITLRLRQNISLRYAVPGGCWYRDVFQITVPDSYRSSERRRGARKSQSVPSALDTRQAYPRSTTRRASQTPGRKKPILPALSRDW
jgi:hypothetical protein